VDHDAHNPRRRAGSKSLTFMPPFIDPSPLSCEISSEAMRYATTCHRLGMRPVPNKARQASPRDRLQAGPLTGSGSAVSARKCQLCVSRRAQHLGSDSWWVEERAGHYRGSSDLSVGEGIGRGGVAVRG
jgi:hypothetical protein